MYCLAGKVFATKFPYFIFGKPYCKKIDEGLARMVSSAIYQFNKVCPQKVKTLPFTCAAISRKVPERYC